ncbi:MAG TPA: sulfite exporter TauE/SafE family protein [Candidatus Binataceae bacterium]|nr:sulfite exporter TauE/SafE family protein [Candidatus Binataceae bacterium]
MPFTPTIIGAAAAFFAAALNSIAGGGTFIAFPTLAAVVGLGAKLANATCTVGLWPGFAAGLAAVRRDLAALPRGRLIRLIVASASGGALGGVLLLLTPAGTFREVVPVLLGTGTLLFALAPRVTRGLNRPDSHDFPAPAGVAALAGISIYNGYFGAGSGVMVMAALAATGMHDPRRANLFKMVNQFASNAAAVIVLSVWGVAWPVAAGMWVGALAGGFFGMRIANRVPRGALRTIVIAAGTVLTIAYGWSAY